MKKVMMKESENGKVFEAMRFSTRDAAERYMSKKDNRRMVFAKAGQYYVSK